MAKETVESRIRNYYEAEKGEWLVEKGKMKEARLLKEAVERIETLKMQVCLEKSFSEYYLKELNIMRERANKLEASEKKLKQREQLMKTAIADCEYTLRLLKS